jgi:hypothetical protein
MAGSRRGEEMRHQLQVHACCEPVEFCVANEKIMAKQKLLSPRFWIFPRRKVGDPMGAIQLQARPKLTE